MKELFMKLSYSFLFIMLISFVNSYPLYFLEISTDENITFDNWYYVYVDTFDTKHNLTDIDKINITIQNVFNESDMIRTQEGKYKKEFEIRNETFSCFNISVIVFQDNLSIEKIQEFNITKETFSDSFKKEVSDISERAAKIISKYCLLVSFTVLFLFILYLLFIIAKSQK